MTFWRLETLTTLPFSVGASEILIEFTCMSYATSFNDNFIFFKSNQFVIQRKGPFSLHRVTDVCLEDARYLRIICSSFFFFFNLLWLQKISVILNKFGSVLVLLFLFFLFSLFLLWRRISFFFTCWRQITGSG